MIGPLLYIFECLVLIISHADKTNNSQTILDLYLIDVNFNLNFVCYSNVKKSIVHGQRFYCTIFKIVSFNTYNKANSCFPFNWILTEYNVISNNQSNFKVYKSTCDGGQINSLKYRGIFGNISIFLWSR